MAYFDKKEHMFNAVDLLFNINLYKLYYDNKKFIQQMPMHLLLSMYIQLCQLWLSFFLILGHKKQLVILGKDQSPLKMYLRSQINKSLKKKKKKVETKGSEFLHRIHSALIIQTKHCRSCEKRTSNPPI